MTRTGLLVCVVALTGCDLYFGNGGDDAPCVSGGTRPDSAYAQYRDPATGTCIGWDEGYDCDDTCGPCPAIDIAPPDMGQCYSQCTDLDEYSCQATAGCYASYDDDPTADGKRDYSGCWQTAPSSPQQASCVGADAYECSRHDDCSIVYATLGGSSKFLTCVAEPTAQYCYSDSECGPDAYCDTTNCYAPPGCNDPNIGCPAVCYGVCVQDTPSCTNVLCAPGYHCEEQCYGDTDPLEMDWCTTACVPDVPSCSQIDCGPGYECVETCELTNNGTLWCGAYCSPANNDPGSCYGDVLCDALPPACPSGTTPGVANGCWTGYCIPNHDCGPNDPGECYGAVACDALPPACPTGTTPGIANGCYTGYCIPEHQCAAPACESLSSEAACQARVDCSPVYTGTNCTCTPNGCTCSTLSYDRCESQYMPF